MNRIELPVAEGQALRLLQLSDTHLFANSKGNLLNVITAESLQAVIQAVLSNSQNFDAVLCTGDISQDHSDVSYQRFIALIEQLCTPTYCLPGNHDEPQALRAQLKQSHNIQLPRQVVTPHWQIVMLDSQVVGRPEGRLSDGELQALDQTLASEPNKHALIALHHHIHPVGSRWLDPHILRNHDALWEVLLAHRHVVKAVLSGHVHQQYDHWHHDIRVMTSPSTCVQFKPHSVDFSVDELAPGWRTLDLLPDGGIASAVWRLPTGVFMADSDSAGY